MLIAAIKLNQYGSLSKVFNLPYEKLKELLGEKTALYITLIKEISSRK